MIETGIDVEASSERHRTTPPLEFLRSTEGASDPQTLYERSWHLNCLGRRDEAVASARRALQQLPNDRNAQLRVVIVERLGGLRTPENAASEVLRLFAEEQDEIRLARVRVMVAGFYLAQEGSTHRRIDASTARSTELAAAATALLALAPRDPWGLVVLATARHQLKDNPGALEAIDRLHEVGMPPCPVYYRNEAVIANSTRQSKKQAAAAWRRQQELLGQRATRWGQLAFLHFLWLYYVSIVPLVLALAFHNYWLFGIGMATQVPLVYHPARILGWRTRQIRKLLFAIVIELVLIGGALTTNFGRHATNPPPVVPKSGIALTGGCTYFPPGDSYGAVVIAPIPGFFISGQQALVHAEGAGHVISTQSSPWEVGESQEWPINAAAGATGQLTARELDAYRPGIVEAAQAALARCGPIPSP